MPKNHYANGDWNVICDSCGKKVKASLTKRRWDGLIVCPEDFEIRHEQDFVRARQDKITVPFIRPRPEDVFVVGPVCDGFTIQGLADIGVADCAKANLNTGLRIFNSIWEGK